jgi:hypothetical protein
MGMALKAQSNIAHVNTGRTDRAFFVVFCVDEETRDLTRTAGDRKREGLAIALVTATIASPHYHKE